jgi:hypothetical protein
MIFKIYNSDLGIKINGQDYQFTHVEGMAIENPEQNRLIRGANASNKVGLSYKEGIREPKRLTVTIIGMSPELKAVLDSAYQNQTRLEAYCIDRLDGSSKIARNAVLSQEPMQLAVDETAESMNVALVFESFDLSEVHKS